ncbi:hypothetical protein BC826DRAFT_1034821 [Russula brevipes]|nr:hypothetical protein BC826DRAFT_1034821 [Russula brevipes]
MHAKQSVARPGNAPPYPPSRNNSRSMDPESHPETTLQERPSYATIDRKAPFDDPPTDAAGSAPAGASSQRLRTRDPHFEDHRTPTVPMPASSSHQTTANRKDFGGPEVELGIRPRGSQPPVGAGNSQSVAVQPTNPSDISTSKEAPSRVGRHEAVGASSSPISSTTRPSPATIPPPSQNVPSTRISQETRGDISFGLPRMEAPRKSDRFSPPQTDSHLLQLSSPSLNRPNPPTNHSSSPSTPALTTTASSRVQASVRYGAAPPELPRPNDERSAKGYAEEARYANPSATSHKQQSPLVPTPQPASEPRRFVKDDSRIEGIEGIDREAKRPTDELTSDKVRKRGPVSDERATHRDDSITHSGSVHRRKAEPNPTSSHAPILDVYGLAPPLGGPQAFIAPPPPVPSNEGPIAPGTAPTQETRSPHGPSAPPLSYLGPSNDFASRAFREAQFESKAGSVVPSPLTPQSDHPLASPWNHTPSYHAVPSSSRYDPLTTTQPVGEKNTSRDSRMSPLYSHSLHGNKLNRLETPVKEIVRTQPSPMETSHPLDNNVRQSAHSIIARQPSLQPIGRPSGSRLPEQHKAAPSTTPWATRPTDFRRGDSREPEFTALEGLAFSPPKSPFSGRPRPPQAPGEIVPPPRLAAVPPIAQPSVPPGGVVPGSTQERFSYLAINKFSNDENDGSRQGRSVGGAPHWKGQDGGLSESGLPEPHRAAPPRAPPAIRAFDSHGGEQESVRPGPPGVGPQDHKKDVEVRENSVLLHTKGTARADATCWSLFRSLFSRSSRKSSPD